MKKILTTIFSVLLVIGLSGCSTIQNSISNDGKVTVYDFTEELSTEEILAAESISTCDDIAVVFCNEYVATRHLGDEWVIVIMPTEITVHHSVYDDETCAVMANTVAKAARGLDNAAALNPVVSAAAKKAKAIAIEEAAYTVFMIGLVAFVAMTVLASLISDAVPSNSLLGRTSSAFLGFAVGVLSSGGGSHKSSSFGGRSGGSATVRR